MELKLVSRNNPAKVIVITSCPFVLGNAPDCDYCLDEEGVSSPHACVVEENEHFYVVDLKSRNGTHVIHPKEGQPPALTNVPVVEKPADVDPQHLLPGAELVEGAIVAFAGSLFICSVKSSLPPDTTLHGPLIDKPAESAPVNTAIANPRITVVNGPEAGRVIELASVPVVLGSSRKQSDIPFPRTQRVSRAHARISRTDDGDIVLEDVQSRNGTFVNGQRITQPQELSDGDRISLAREIEFIFCMAGKVCAPLSPKKQKLPVMLILAMGLAGVLVMGAVLWLKGPGTQPVRGSDATPRALTEVTQPEAVPKPPELPGAPVVGEKHGSDENAAIIERTERLLAAVKGWHSGELQLAHKTISTIPDTDSCGARKAVCLTEINARLNSIHQLDAACDRVEQGDYQEALLLIDKSLGFAPNNDDADYAKDGIGRLVQLKNMSATATNVVIDYRSFGVQVSNALDSFYGDEKLPRLLRRQVERIVAPTMAAVVSDVQALRDRGQYLKCLARIHDGLALLPKNKECRDVLASIEPDTRRVLTDMIAKAYWLENERSHESQDKAADMYAEIAQATSLNDWTREFHLTATQRLRR